MQPTLPEVGTVSAPIKTVTFTVNITADGEVEGNRRVLVLASAEKLLSAVSTILWDLDNILHDFKWLDKPEGALKMVLQHHDAPSNIDEEWLKESSGVEQGLRIARAKVYEELERAGMSSLLSDEGL